MVVRRSRLWLVILVVLLAQSLLASLSPGAAAAAPPAAPGGPGAVPADTTPTPETATATATPLTATMTAPLTVTTTATTLPSLTAPATATATAATPLPRATATLSATATTPTPRAIATATPTTTPLASRAPRSHPAPNTPTVTATLTATATATLTATAGPTPAGASAGAGTTDGVRPFSNVGICPPSWFCADIGGASPAGSQTLANASWSVSGGGLDIWGTSDQFHYVWQPLPGSGSVSARVITQTVPTVNAKAGVMLRASTDPGAPTYLVDYDGGTDVVQYRATAGGSSVILAQISGSLPVYLKAVRAGSTFTAYTSGDGQSWTPIPGSQVSIPALAGAALAGLAVDSYSTSATSTAQFDTVRLGSLSWNPGVTALPAALFDAPAATGADGRVYVFGGTDGTGDSRTTYIYTPATDGWTIGASLPTTHTAGQAVALPNGDIAVIGGATGCGGSYGLPCSGGAVSKGVDVYTPSADAWNLAGHTLPALTTARQRFAAVLYQGSLYVLGGATTSATLASVETYNLAAHPAAWSAGPSLPLPRWA